MLITEADFTDADTYSALIDFASIPVSNSETFSVAVSDVTSVVVINASTY